ncbi:MAG TPA: YlxR family protein [Tepidiformaceae bacterium]
MKAAKGPRPRHVPQRTCIGCRQEEGKRTFIRIVRTPDQRLVIDPTGKANGRGAYLHPWPSCWEKALKGGTIVHALKFNPAREDVEALRAFGMALPAEEGNS